MDVKTDEIIEGYFDFVYSNRAKKGGAYKNELTIFLKHTNCVYLPLTVQLIRGYLSKYEEHMPNTYNAHLNRIKQFYVYLVLTEVITGTELDRVFRLIKQRKAVREIKDRVTEDELRFYLNRVKGYIGKKYYPRIHISMIFLLFTGLRISELLNLKRRDVHLTSANHYGMPYIHVRGQTKNLRERVVPFPLRIAKEVQAYFIKEQEGFNAFNISKKLMDEVSHAVRYHLPQGTRFSAHTLRHSFGLLLEEGGVSINDAQQLFGHKSMQSTLIYFRPNIKTAMKSYKTLIT